MLVVFPGDFGKVFWFCAWKKIAPKKKTNIISPSYGASFGFNNCKINQKKKSTVFFHVLFAGIAKHLRRCRSGRQPVAVDHHLHVFVHGTGPVHELETQISKSLDRGICEFTAEK